MASKFYITTAKERLALKDKTLYELKKTAMRRVNQYWSLQRCMDSLDIIEREISDRVEGFKELNMTVEQMLVGRFVFEVIEARGVWGD